MIDERKGFGAFPRGTEHPIFIAKEDGTNEGHTVSVSGPEYARIIAVAVAALFCWLKLRRPYPGIDVFGLAATCIGGYPIFKRALSSLSRRHLTTELSLSLAITIAFVSGNQLRLSP